MEKHQELRLVCLRRPRRGPLVAKSRARPRENPARHPAPHPGCPPRLRGRHPRLSHQLRPDPRRRSDVAHPRVGAHLPRTIDERQSRLGCRGRLQCHGRLDDDVERRAPILSDGRVVFTAADSDAVRCLDLHSRRVAVENLAHARRPVRRRGARRQSVAGEQEQQPACTASPTAARFGSSRRTAPRTWARPPANTYYLPLEKGGLLALNLDNPKESAHIAAHSPHKPGNLLFHGDLLWSQDVLSLMAYPEMSTNSTRRGARLKSTAATPPC